MTMNIGRTVRGVGMASLLAVGIGSVAEAQDAFHCVPARSTDQIKIWVRAGQHQVAVTGDGDTDLDFSFFNDANVLLHEDNDRTDFTTARWRQDRPGYVTVNIRNIGNISNCYTVVVR